MYVNILRTYFFNKIRRCMILMKFVHFYNFICILKVGLTFSRFIKSFCASSVFKNNQIFILLLTSPQIFSFDFFYLIPTAANLWIIFNYIYEEANDTSKLTNFSDYTIQSNPDINLYSFIHKIHYETEGFEIIRNSSKN